MAISGPHYHCLRELHRRGELPQGGSVLEIGEANWYGDIAPPGELASCGNGYAVVQALYQLLFDAKSVVSIDLHGTAAAARLDLNMPHGLDLFDAVINHGTAEHVFNIAQVFKTMHDACAVGGLMIHESPLTGWIDHGFWTIQPTAYYDLALANHYLLIFMAVEHIEHGSVVEIHSREHLLRMAKAGGIPNNAMLYVAMRKSREQKFLIPMQGVYAGTAGAEAATAWKELR